MLSWPARAAPANLADQDVINFLLNFQYLSAVYYLSAVLGTPSSLLVPIGSQPGILPTSTLVAFRNPATAYYGIRLGADQQAQAELFQSLVANLANDGSYPIPAPILNLDADPSTGAWSLAAQQAGLVGPGQVFNPYEDEVSFMLGATMLADAHVSALCGASSLLTTDTANYYVSKAIGAQAEQAGAIRGYLSRIGGGIATNAISAMRAGLSGAVDQGTAVPGNAYRFADLDDNSLAASVTPGQALAVAYGGAGRTSGWFFPQGVNGLFAGTVSG